MRRAAVAALAVALVAACSSPAEPVVLGPTSTPTPQADTSALLEARRDAGIPDCPDASTSTVEKSDGLPDLTLSCLGESSEVRLAGLRGKPMVINVWASWCGPCREESGHLRRFAERAGDEVELLGILYQEPDPAGAIEFAHLAGWTWPHVVDAARDVRVPLKVAGPPTTLFVRADGSVAFTKAGAFASTEEIVEIAERELGVNVS